MKYIVDIPDGHEANNCELVMCYKKPHNILTHYKINEEIPEAKIERMRHCLCDIHVGDEVILKNTNDAFDKAYLVTHISKDEHFDVIDEYGIPYRFSKNEIVKLSENCLVSSYIKHSNDERYDG